MGGIGKIAAGLASQNYIQAAVGAIEVIPWKKVFTVIGVILLFVLISLFIILSLPQMLFSWSASAFESLQERNQHGTEMVAYYYTFLGQLDEDVDPDIPMLICIQAVLSKQDVQSITKHDVERMILASYTVDQDNLVYNKTAEEIMDDLGMDDEQKNWANLMYNTITAQNVEERRILK